MASFSSSFFLDLGHFLVPIFSFYIFCIWRNVTYFKINKNLSSLELTSISTLILKAHPNFLWRITKPVRTLNPHCPEWCLLDPLVPRIPYLDLLQDCCLLCTSHGLTAWWSIASDSVCTLMDWVSEFWVYWWIFLNCNYGLACLSSGYSMYIRWLPLYVWGDNLVWPDYI